MKVTKQLQVRSITHYDFELDPQIKIQPEQLKTIVDTIIQYGNPPRVSIISILGDDDGSFSLDFDSFDKLYAYVKTHNMWDADTFVLQHEYYSDILNFGFGLWTNRMNVGFSNFEPEEVLRLVERIEAALLGNSAEVPPVTRIPEPVIPQSQPQKKTPTCPKCGKAVHEDHLFCCHCGADLRIPLCRFCNKEIPENATFCPWCGKAQADQYVPAKSEPTQPSSDSAPRFTQAQTERLRSLLKEIYPKLEFRFSEAEIFLGEYESIWGALDGCGTDSTEITITPIRLATFDLQDLNPGFRLNNVGCTELFRRLADSAQGSQTPLVYSVSRDYFHRRNKNGTCEHVHKSCSLAVRNPMSIGVDLLVTYENYDDMD